MKGIRSLSSFLSFLILPFLVLSGCSGLLRKVGGGMTEELRRGGVTATAEILEIWDTGITINRNPVIGMRVRVQPPGGEAFDATIEKATISRLAIPQFQPGQLVPIRFDPDDPTLIAIDPEGRAQSLPSSGNPYRDRFVRSAAVGAAFLPPPAAPQLYLGTADSAADALALFENGYLLLGGSSVSNASDPGQDIEQGKEIGAALVVVYGHFVRPPGLALDVLPFHPRPPEQDRPTATDDVERMMLVSGLGPDDQFAAYWGKTRPAILGIGTRSLDGEERARLGRSDGIVVSGVVSGSPAAAAGIAIGDVIVAIDREPLDDVLAIPALVASHAGQEVRIDLIRDGSPLSVTALLGLQDP